MAPGVFLTSRTAVGVNRGVQSTTFGPSGGYFNLSDRSTPPAGGLSCSIGSGGDVRSQPRQISRPE